MVTQSLSTQHKPAIAVIGAGSWATALVKILSEGAVDIRWWLRNQESLEHIRRYQRNPDYLSDVPINPEKVQLFADMKEAVQGAQYVIIAIPAAFVQDALSQLSAADLKGKVLVSAVKGVVPQKNWLITELLEHEYQVKPTHICVIAGPCHAEEVALEKQSYLTIASEDLAQAENFAQLIANRFIKAVPNQDVYGVEYSAVMKNIIALACGIAHGLNYGDNFQAVLVSNAMQEIRRFVETAYPCERDLYASAYLGDLLVTAYSQFSRNRTFGNMIGRGYTVKSAQMEMNMIAEGYYAVKSIYEINQKFGVDMPITKAVYQILYEKVTPGVAIGKLRWLLA
ncbi:NAD(P)H-dependent glycerol-3-phosphate dehydrogenase [uncultured Microscilla sp.]|uniref:NAD(P)H-dependent glycerol-3-phosphate dehydrogenase n=1 Tax=uncultured Microscilla sp. TaxID=432653 RepID=UPI0026331441|nr:NAD(P)H-dependent glycerol-3-phosphate dehydrogenase [uncultured Microscilla sp.]